MDFEELVDKYQKPIYNLILRLIGDVEEAADLTQETFVAAFKSMQTFRGQSSEYTWLYRIAINRCKNKFKENQRRSKIESYSLDDKIDEDSSTTISDTISSDEQPDVLVSRKELKEQIERAISQLPQDYRIVSVLRDLNGLSYQEIANITDSTIDVVRTRIARARGMLREKLAAYLKHE